jgi:hypothetical protein
VRGEGVAERVTGGAAIDLRGERSRADGLLHRRVVEVPEDEAAGRWIDAGARRGRRTATRGLSRRRASLRGGRRGGRPRPGPR